MNSRIEGGEHRMEMKQMGITAVQTFCRLSPDNKYDYPFYCEYELEKSKQGVILPRGSLYDYYRFFVISLYRYFKVNNINFWKLSFSEMDITVREDDKRTRSFRLLLPDDRLAPVSFDFLQSENFENTFEEYKIDAFKQCLHRIGSQYKDFDKRRLFKNDLSLDYIGKMEYRDYSVSDVPAFINDIKQVIGCWTTQMSSMLCDYMRERFGVDKNFIILQDAYNFGDAQ